MTRQQLLAEAKMLDPKEQELLAEDLWQNLDHTTRDEISEAWAMEIQRRLQLLDSGQMNAIPADEVFARLRDKLTL
jgi:putative addiction module component (TIGR02574 family)